jgi:hypothetical protein
VKKLLSSLFALALVASLGSSAWAQGANPVTQQVQVEVLLYESLKIESNPGVLSLSLNPADPMEQSTIAMALNYQTNANVPDYSARKITMESSQEVDQDGVFTVEIENAQLSDIEMAPGGSGGTLVGGANLGGQNLDDFYGAAQDIVTGIHQALGTLSMNFHIDLLDGSSNLGTLAAPADVTTDVVYTLTSN